MAQYNGNLIDENGHSIQGASVFVHDMSGAAASISDIDNRPIKGPLITDGDGNFAYRAADGVYQHCIWFGNRLLRMEGPVFLGHVQPPGQTWDAMGPVANRATDNGNGPGRASSELAGAYTLDQPAAARAADQLCERTQANAVASRSKALLAAASGAILVGFSEGARDGVADEARHNLRDGVVSILNYYVPEIDATDFAPAVGRAYDDGVSHLYLPLRASGYDFVSGVAREIDRDFVFDANGQVMNFALAGKIRLSGKVIASGRALASSAPRYARQVTLDSAADIRPGDLLLINTAISPLVGWADTKQDVVRVAGMRSTTIALHDQLNFSYKVDDPGLSVKVYRPQKFTLIRPIIHLEHDNENRLPTTSFELEGLDGITINQPRIYGDRPFDRTNNVYRYGIYLYRCVNWLVDAPDYEALSYPIGVYASRYGNERNPTARYCHHAHADQGYFSSDYRLTGLTSRNCYQSLNTHPSFRCTALNADVRGDTGLSNWRVFGGSWNNVFIETSADDAAELPQFQNLTPVGGYEYLNADADIAFDTVEVVAANRVTKPAIAVAYGRKASFARVKTSFLESSMAARDNLALLEIGPGCDFGGRRTPTLNGIRNAVAFAGIEPLLDAEFIRGVYHIDPRGQMMPHKDGLLVCHGQIGNFNTAKAQFVFRIHTNVFSDAEQVNNCLIELKLIIESRAPGTAFNRISDSFRWSFKASANSDAALSLTPTASEPRRGRPSSLTLSNPVYAGVSQIGVNGDHYVGATATVDLGSPHRSHALRYELSILRLA